MLRRTITASMLVIAVGTSLSLLSCRQDDAPVRDSAAALTPPAHDFGVILASAKSSAYTYESPRNAVDAKDPSDITHPGVPESSAPTMTIAKAIRASTPTPLTEEVLAKIVSSSAYPDLGLRPGDNYVWRYRGPTQSQQTGRFGSFPIIRPTWRSGSAGAPTTSPTAITPSHEL